MKIYKIHYQTTANGINCTFIYKDEFSGRIKSFYKKNYKDEYEFANAVFNFETKLLENGYVKEGDAIDYE